MRTAQEIVERCRSNKEDFLDFQAEALSDFLTFEEVQPLLKPQPKAEEWPEAKPRTREAVVAAMRDYMQFAWGKVEDHRGISASRSVEKMQAWLWLLEDQATLDAVAAAPFENYGAPQLAVICKAYDFPVPDEEWARNMIASQPCSPHCEDGCGR